MGISQAVTDLKQMASELFGRGRTGTPSVEELAQMVDCGAAKLVEVQVKERVAQAALDEVEADRDQGVPVAESRLQAAREGLDFAQRLARMLRVNVGRAERQRVATAARDREAALARHQEELKAKFTLAHEKMKALEEMVQRFGPAAVEAQAAVVDFYAFLSPAQQSGLNPAGRPNALAGEVEIALACASNTFLGSLHGVSLWTARQRPAISLRFAENAHVVEGTPIAVEQASGVGA